MTRNRSRISYEYALMGRKVAYLGLVVFLALVLVASMTLSTTLDGCRDIMTRVVCEPGATLVVEPA